MAILVLKMLISQKRSLGSPTVIENSVGVAGLKRLIGLSLWALSAIFLARLTLAEPDVHMPPGKLGMECHKLNLELGAGVVGGRSLLENNGGL